VVFELLANQRRREALYVLYRREGPITVAELADEVATVVEAAPERVATSLYHVHLPKLADADIVDYDVQSGIVRLTHASEQFDRYLHIAAADEGRFIRAVDEEAGTGDRDAPQSES
jgi:DNA-binding transcriptional ArsR family regulator